MIHENITTNTLTCRPYKTPYIKSLIAGCCDTRMYYHA